VAESNPNARLECFCDGVFAIALTLLIIDVKMPPIAIGSNADFWLALRNIVPAIMAFTLSFIVILITWVNGQHYIEHDKSFRRKVKRFQF
jgi:uncharacterized membrane protein